MLANKSNELQKAVSVLKELSADEATRMLVEAEEKARLDALARLQYAETKGIEQGEKKKAIEMAKSLLKSGVDISLIVSSSGLSQEEIENL